MTDNQSSPGASRRKFLTVAGSTGAIALAGCASSEEEAEEGGNGGSTGDDMDLSGTIDVAGSSTVFPLMEAVGAGFKQEHSDVEINISSTGSGGGFANHFCPGRTDFNNASRPMKEEEKQMCRDNNIEWIELVVATDALTVVVNNDSPIDCMTVEELAQVWEADAASTWNEVNSSWPSEPIERFGAADTSGTYDYFIENVQGTDRGHTDDYQATERDDTIAQGVQGSQYAIGYFGFSYYFQNQDQLKAVEIDNGNGCTAPSLDNAASGSYQPLSRNLYTYPKKSALADQHVAEFAKYLLEKSTDEEIVANQVGYVPNTSSVKDEMMSNLQSAIDEAQ